MISDLSHHSEEVSLRSKPIRIDRFTYPSGRQGFLVVGTIMPRQKPWRQKCDDLAEAERIRAEWESDRQRVGRGMRLRATNLSNEVLQDAENAWAVAKKKGYVSLLDVVLAMTEPKPVEKAEASESKAKTYRELHDLFVPQHFKHASKPQSDKVRQTSLRFGAWIGWDTAIDTITTKDIHAWGEEESHDNKRTYNHKVNNICRVFSWACEPMQEYLAKNPASAIPRYNKRVLPQGAKQILSIERCVALTCYLEANHPQWCWAFALMLFAGVRPGYHDGEIRKLVCAVNRDGLETYFCGSILRLTADITKDRRPRKFTIPPNLASWLNKYAPQPKKASMGSKESYAEIREKFNIPHDGLRHTAISAHVSKHDRFALAAEQFGNSERVIRDNYFSRMMPEQAEAFYNIYPID